MTNLLLTTALAFALATGHTSEASEKVSSAAGQRMLLKSCVSIAGINALDTQLSLRDFLSNNFPEYEYSYSIAAEGDIKYLTIRLSDSLTEKWFSIRLELKPYANGSTYNTCGPGHLSVLRGAVAGTDMGEGYTAVVGGDLINSLHLISKGRYKL